MPTQTIKISRPPEEPPLETHELKRIISALRTNAEWSVVDVTNLPSQQADSAETCELHEYFMHCDTHMKYCPECGERFC